MLCVGCAGDELGELRALLAGADDWIAQPVRYAALLARVAGLLRRAGRRRSSGSVRIGSLVLDAREHTVQIAERRVATSGGIGYRLLDPVELPEGNGGPA